MNKEPSIPAPPPPLPSLVVKKESQDVGKIQSDLASILQARVQKRQVNETESLDFII